VIPKGSPTRPGRFPTEPPPFSCTTLQLSRDNLSRNTRHANCGTRPDTPGGVGRVMSSFYAPCTLPAQENHVSRLARMHARGSSHILSVAKVPSKTGTTGPLMDVDREKTSWNAADQRPAAARTDCFANRPQGAVELPVRRHPLPFGRVPSRRKQQDTDRSGLSRRLCGRRGYRPCPACFEVIGPPTPGDK